MEHAQGKPGRPWGRGKRGKKMNHAADYGYTTELPVRAVRVGDTFRLKCALGIYESRVLRPHHAGYFETVHERWVTEVPAAFGQRFDVGCIRIMSRADILTAMYAD